MDFFLFKSFVHNMAFVFSLLCAGSGLITPPVMVKDKGSSPNPRFLSVGMWLFS